MDNTVSVISSLNSTYLGTIELGGGSSPGVSHQTISVDYLDGKVYVTNEGDGTVSVINSKSNSNNTIGTIKVGSSPSAIGVDSGQDKVYVVNTGDNTVSAIDETTNNVIAAVTFSVKPFNAGHIECGKDRLIAPVVQQFYTWSASPL
jgi:YVTN family beta-propeller protein